MTKENGGQDKEEFAQYMEVVDRRLNNLKLLVNQLFDYSFSKEKIDLVPMFQHIDFEYGYIFRRMGNEWVLKVEEDAIVFQLDREKFMRAMGNLLENVRKYSMPGTKVMLEVSVIENCVQICLSNEKNVGLHGRHIQAVMEERRVYLQMSLPIS